MVKSTLGVSGVSDEVSSQLFAENQLLAKFGSQRRSRSDVPECGTPTECLAQKRRRSSSDSEAGATVGSTIDAESLCGIAATASGPDWLEALATFFATPKEELYVKMSGSPLIGCEDKPLGSGDEDGEQSDGTVARAVLANCYSAISSRCNSKQSTARVFDAADPQDEVLLGFEHKPVICPVCPTRIADTTDDVPTEKAAQATSEKYSPYVEWPTTSTTSEKVPVYGPANAPIEFTLSAGGTYTCLSASIAHEAVTQGPLCLPLPAGISMLSSEESGLDVSSSSDEEELGVLVGDVGLRAIDDAAAAAAAGAHVEDWVLMLDEDEFEAL
jgi:hypothetical protein